MLEEGTILAGYRIEGLIGQGGMGVVYRATQLALDRVVALKLLASNLSRDEAFRERFRREGLIQAAIDHPHIVTVYEAGESEEGLFLAMRLVDGPNLKQLIEGGELDLERSIRLLSQVAEALDAAHKAGLIHRDVKPQNVLVGPGPPDHAYLVDFGLTKALGRESLTQAGQLLGTPDYISPEQARGEPAGSPADVYSLTAVLYECLSGAVPYLRSSTAGVLSAHLVEAPPRLGDARPDLPAHLTTVVERGMAKDPGARYSSAGELMADARRVFAEEAGPALAQASFPAPASTLIGRVPDVEEICSRLRADVRLLTLTGPGGVGKSRLALEVGGTVGPEFPDGAVLVALAPVRDPQLVLPTIAQSLSIGETGAEPLLQTVGQHLRSREVLLVLDNFEQVLPAAPVLGELLSAAPDLRLLVTSREPLHLVGEREYAVPPLPDADAVALFAARAEAVQADLDLGDGNGRAVAELCRRLDGIPLAIELAAARVKLLSPEGLLSRLESRLAMLTGGARDLPARHQTMRDTIEWSYELLEPPEQSLFGCLSVFAGGWTLEAAEQVCKAGLDEVASLVDKSLVQRRRGEDGEPRLEMLETIREYALERLEASGKSDAVRERHAEFYLDLVEQAEEQLRVVHGAGWLARLEAEHDNLRFALSWALEREKSEVALRLGAALGRFWYLRGHLSEGRKLLARVLGHSDGEASPVRAKALYHASALASMQGDYAQAREFGDEQLAICRELRDQDGIRRSLGHLGLVAMGEGELDRAEALLEQSGRLARELGDTPAVAASANNLGNLALQREDYERAAALFEESVGLYRGLADDQGTAVSLFNVGLVAVYRNRHGEARESLEESLRISRELGNKEGIAYCLEVLAAVLLEARDAERSALALGAAAEIAEAMESSLQPAERQLHDRTVASLRQELGADRFAAVWTEGRSLLLEEAIAVTLGDLQAPRTSGV